MTVTAMADARGPRPPEIAFPHQDSAARSAFQKPEESQPQTTPGQTPEPAEEAQAGGGRKARYFLASLLLAGTAAVVLGPVVYARVAPLVTATSRHIGA